MEKLEISFSVEHNGMIVVTDESAGQNGKKYLLIDLEATPYDYSYSSGMPPTLEYKLCYKEKD